MPFEPEIMKKVNFHHHKMRYLVELKHNAYYHLLKYLEYDKIVTIVRCPTPSSATVAITGA